MRSVGRMWRGWGLTAFSLIAACSSGADGEEPNPDEGAVAVSASALSAVDVASVKVTISGSGISTPIVTTLAKVGGRWQGLIGKIPSGTNRSFHGDALDSQGSVVYRGDVLGVTITKNTTSAVAMLLQQANAPTPFANNAPVVDGMVVSTNAPAVGESVTLSATAHDNDVGDSIRYEWVASNGTFSTATDRTTTWFAPPTEGAQTITLRVYDTKGSMNALSFSTNVTAGFGSASVTAKFNTWPSVNGVVASPSRIDVGETTALTLDAFDNDGDALSYAWSATCAGSFSNATIANPAFTLTAPAANGTCGLVVTVSDGRGGSNTGTLGIQTGPATPPNVAPQVDSTFQSTASAGDGEEVILRVHAFDPEGTAVSYAWSADNGVVVATNANGTDAKWTAPAAFTGQAIISAIVTDASGLSNTQPFVVTASSRSAALPVAPTTTRFGWQGAQTAFLDANGAPCTGRVAVATSDHATCYTASDDTLKCSGATFTTTYGNGFVDAGRTGVDQILLSPTVNSATRNAACVHDITGSVLCFGDFNASGQFNNGAIGPASTWTPWGAGSYSRIATGTWDQMCALDSSGHVTCSGYSFGQAAVEIAPGAAHESVWVTPYGTALVDDPAVQRAGEGYTECTIASSSLVCNGTSFGSNVVMGGLVLTPEGEYACWLDASGHVSCQAMSRSSWTAPVQTLTSAGSLLAVAISTYSPTICAVAADGSLWCGEVTMGGSGGVQVEPPGSARVKCE
jgi:hypothetical protein